MVPQLHETMPHAETNRCWTAGVSTQCLLVESKGSSEVLLIEGNTSLAEQGGDVVWRLIEYKVELGICLLHLVPFQQTEVCTSQQMVLKTGILTVTIEDNVHN